MTKNLTVGPPVRLIVLFTLPLLVGNLPDESPMASLIQDLVNSTPPAWQRLDRYLRDGLANQT